ncbi:hypothetical protein J2Z22_001569 [Paenibacillus forsythiae]|uniref:Fibronectin type-III domain-containing protein n=1 Tax=Paenibacillus forsythiae TaxID=365616 RepID=A0ABU3H5H7_9BACL|nr:fibronectin type III domain-containing protein [Paenibacillus forsythiae]MDT3426049.1 hypothetical protein [Paenibacillus forsythiae]
MKKFLHLLLLVMIIFLLVQPATSFAYTGGLINGKAMCLSNGISLEGTESPLASDNNLNTYVTLPKWSSVVSEVDTLYYQFDCPMDITAYQLKADSTGITLYFVFSDGSHTSLDNAIKVGTQTEIDYKNVVAVGMQSVNIAKIYEFDVFGDSNKTAPSVPTEIKATPDNSSVLLSWKPNTEPDFSYYNIYKDGILLTSVTNSTYEITDLIEGTEYTFQISAVDCALNESEKSEISTVIPISPQPSGNRAILVVTMITGLEKEFDLSMGEVNAFLDWYDSRDSGTGPARFAIDKHDNNKGPFKNRKDYVIFDKILTFEISEYTAD